jgi:hypothetical protein
VSRAPRRIRTSLDVREFDIRPVDGLPDTHLALMQDENVALYAATLRSLLD